MPQGEGLEDALARVLDEIENEGGSEEPEPPKVERLPPSTPPAGEPPLPPLPPPDAEPSPSRSVPPARVSQAEPPPPGLPPEPALPAASSRVPPPPRRGRVGLRVRAGVHWSTELVTFNFVEKVSDGGCGWEATCPYHKGTATAPKCRKFIRSASGGVDDMDIALRAAKVFCKNSLRCFSLPLLKLLSSVSCRFLCKLL